MQGFSWHKNTLARGPLALMDILFILQHGRDLQQSVAIPARHLHRHSCQAKSCQNDSRWSSIFSKEHAWRLALTIPHCPHPGLTLTLPAASCERHSRPQEVPFHWLSNFASMSTSTADLQTQVIGVLHMASRRRHFGCLGVPWRDLFDLRFGFPVQHDHLSARPLRLQSY